jgi:uncharacterized protein YqjF (DUF2071 family)
MIFKSVIEIYTDVDDEGSACDALSETLREHLRRFTPESAIVDWQYANDGHPEPATQAEIDALEI